MYITIFVLDKQVHIIQSLNINCNESDIAVISSKAVDEAGSGNQVVGAETAMFRSDLGATQ